MSENISVDSMISMSFPLSKAATKLINLYLNEALGYHCEECDVNRGHLPISNLKLQDFVNFSSDKEQ